MNSISILFLILGLVKNSNDDKQYFYTITSSEELTLKFNKDNQNIIEVSKLAKPSADSDSEEDESSKKKKSTKKTRTSKKDSESTYDEKALYKSDSNVFQQIWNIWTDPNSADAKNYAMLQQDRLDQMVLDMEIGYRSG